MMTEEDEEYNKKVELLKRHKELLTGDLFRELTFIVITAKQNIEKRIALVSANEEDSTVDLFKEAYNKYVRALEEAGNCVPKHCAKTHFFGMNCEWILTM